MLNVLECGSDIVARKSKPANSFMDAVLTRNVNKCIGINLWKRNVRMRIITYRKRQRKQNMFALIQNVGIKNK